MMRRAFIALVSALFILMPLASLDCGITEDEFVHNHHGEILLDYFQGEKNTADQPPTTDDARPRSPAFGMSIQDPAWSKLNVFPGLFDLTCVFIHRHLPFAGEYESRHIVNSLFGAFCILFIGLFAQALGGWRSGVLAVLFAILSPRLIGHSMNNPKDLPFAALHIFSLYQLYLFLRELPRPSIKRAALLTLGILFSIDVRLAGLLSIGYVFLASGAWVAAHAWREKKFEPILALRIFAYASAIGIAAYFGCTILWPFAHTDPLGVPLFSLKYASQFDIFNSYELFEGHHINRWEIPWYFLPKWLWITTPLFVSFGMLFIPLLFTKRTGVDRQGIALLSFAWIFPLAYVIFQRSNVYDDGRHVLFTLPPLLILCALATEALFKELGEILQGEKKIWVTTAAASLLAAAMAEPAIYMALNHPFENMYFSPLVGGPSGAFGRYEQDFWDTSQRAASEWIMKHDKTGTSAKPIRVRTFYGDPICASYYLNKKPGYQAVLAPEESKDWDYTIVMPASDKFMPGLIAHWPPEGTVYEVTADGAPLSAVVKNYRTQPEGMLTVAQFAARENPTYRNWLWLGFEQYQTRHFEDAIFSFERSLTFKPGDPIAYNDIAAAYGELGNWEKEIQYAKLALQAQPDFEPAKGNLNSASKQRSIASTQAKKP